MTQLGGLVDLGKEGNARYLLNGQNLVSQWIDYVMINKSGPCGLMVQYIHQWDLRGPMDTKSE